MKRSKPLRANPETTRAWKDKSRKPLKRSTTRAPAREAFSAVVCRAVFIRQKGLCACGCGRMISPFPIGYHHVFPKDTRHWPELVNTEGNIVGVFEDCHANHETRSQRLPRTAVASAEPLATTDRMRDYMDRAYGPKLANTSLAPTAD